MMQFAGFFNDIAIDLGTSNTSIYIKGKGIVLREPSIVAAKNDSSRKIITAGNDAKQMVGRTSSGTIIIKPVRGGVVADIDMATKMLEYFIKKVLKRGLLIRPRIFMCYPAGITQVEMLAIKETAYRAGAKKVSLLSMPLVAAIGSGLSVEKHTGNIIIDIGSGKTDISIVSSGDIVINKSLQSAGDEMDKAIIYYIKKRYKLIIGEVTAEQIKKEIGCAFSEKTVKTMAVRGRDLVNEHPKVLTITSTEINKALKEPINSIVNGIRTVLEMTPPELSADIMENGIMLAGGGALLNGFDKLLRKEISLPVNTADSPMDCVAAGAGLAIDRIKGMKLKNSLLPIKYKEAESPI